MVMLLAVSVWIKSDLRGDLSNVIIDYNFQVSQFYLEYNNL